MTVKAANRNVIGWVLGAFATLVYLITLDPTVSFWDCGEFIATSYKLQVGHPPGAPFYQLLAHCFTLLAGGNVMRVAWWSNALSAVSGGATVMFLFWTILRVQHHQDETNHESWWPALVGALCYLFCDTVWFSAVESEVYSLAMLVASAIVWAMLRWRDDPSPRWLLLIALLLGLGVCVHLLILLTLPALLIIYLQGWMEEEKPRPGKRQLATLLFALLFFVMGLSPYLIIPIRANASPPINEGKPATVEAFKRYVTREQYEKAPIYPRMWRHRGNNDKYAAEWSGNRTDVWGNVRYYFTYQLGYMYGRYMMYNFMGRRNETWGHNVYFVLPFLLGLLGLFYQAQRCRKQFWWLLTLFLFSGVILNFYLNHPCYEPRERDYAYVLSFYAFCIWIGEGAAGCLDREVLKINSPKGRRWVCILLLLAPVTLAVGNWSDHDRSGRKAVHDIGVNHLESCDRDAILFTLGDNDTFPLWYLQQVEEHRTDIQVWNINLVGTRRFLDIIEHSDGTRPIYLSQYAKDKYGEYFEGYLQMEGYAYRLMSEPCEEVGVEAFQRHVEEGFAVHDYSHESQDYITRRMLHTFNQHLDQLEEAKKLQQTNTK